MAEKEKQYFWLRMPKDFFKKHYIDILMAKEDGKLYVLFYIWMLTESIDHEGRLRYSDTKPYDDAMLAEVSHYSEEFVSKAMSILQELELAVIEDDGTIFLPKSLRMIGKESESAQRVREYRAKKQKSEPTPDDDSCYNVQECNGDVTECNGDVTECFEEKKSYSKDVDEIVREWNSLKEFGIKTVIKLDNTSKRYQSLIARLNQYGKESIIEAIGKIRNSDFLQGKHAGKPWQITFDWFVLPNNFPKVLEGNYDTNARTGTGDAKLDNIYNRVNEVDNW